METQIWSKAEEKWAYILVLRGNEVHHLKVTGSMVTLKRNLKGVLEALEQGKEPSDAGAKWVETLDARTISKAEVSPENNSLTIKGEGDKAKELSYTTGDSNADEILRAILAQSGRTFQPAQEEIDAIEAVLPPIFVGAVGGLLWGLVYHSAGKLATGEDVEVEGVRRRGLQRMLITVAEILGTNGTIAVGVVLLLLVVGWAAKRLIHRPKRTVWLPETA